jgi:hypothetical protein
MFFSLVVSIDVAVADKLYIRLLIDELMKE